MVETKFEVGMTCSGCADAIKRILGKIDGVQSIDANVDTKIVTVQADPSVSPQYMLEKLEKWGTAAKKTVALV
ncbi:cytosolic copper metallochaperone [Mayamaea pseudoterrestris]|nr:cytosolic copper metallochaperone [Mayamaea pseudoterrestris]